MKPAPLTHSSRAVSAPVPILGDEELTDAPEAFEVTDVHYLTPLRLSQSQQPSVRCCHDDVDLPSATPGNIVDHAAGHCGRPAAERGIVGRNVERRRDVPGPVGGERQQLLDLGHDGGMRPQPL